METNKEESKATSTDWLTQLQDLIEIIDTDEKLAIYSDAQHKEGLPLILYYIYYKFFFILNF